MSTTVMNGTRLYKLAMETVEGELTHPPTSRITLLEDALRHYNSGLSSELDPDLRLTLSKNIGMTALRLAQALVEAKVKGATRRVIYLVNECVRYLTLNWLWRPADRDLEWGSKVSGAVNEAFDVAFRSLGNVTEEANWPKLVHLLDLVLNEIPPESCLDTFRLRFYAERAHFYNGSAAKIMEMNNFILTDRILEYCRRDCQLAREYASALDLEAGSETSESVRVLLQLGEIEEITKFLKASCESVKFRKAADDLLKSALEDSEEVDFELMWDILDMYKAAALCAANEDIKNETIAIARQGMLFHRIFKLETYAKMYCHKAVELANILMVPGEKDKWFWECLGVIGEYQKRQRDEEERKKEEERAPYLEELVEEINELREVENCSLKVLKHVYTKHPPKTDPKFIYDEKLTNSETIRKVLMKAIFHYHPDKQAGFERKWQVLCEEIIKRLTLKYECVKGV